MNQKLQRIFRNRRITAEEAVRDEELRRALQVEFPPATAVHDSRSDSFSEVLRNALRDTKQPIAEIAEKAHLSPLALSKFLAGERDIHLETADRLAEALGIKLATSRASSADLG